MKGYFAVANSSWLLFFASFLLGTVASATPTTPAPEPPLGQEATPAEVGGELSTTAADTLHLTDWTANATDNEVVTPNLPGLVGQSRRRAPLRRSPVRVQPPSVNPVPSSSGAPNYAPAQADQRSEDWATAALESLATRYNCGSAALQSGRLITRTEFASGLLDCITKMEAVIANQAEGSAAADLATLKSLQQEFASELSTLIIRLDQKADKSSQFSTTVKLVGEAVFAMADTFGDRATSGDPTVPVFGYRARLNFNGSFTGKDLLRVRLQARDVAQFSGGASTGTNMTRLGFDGQGGNGLTIDEFFYKFPVGDQTRISLIANAHGSENLATHFSPISSSGRGALSRFARFSPLYRMVEGPGVGVEHNFNDQWSASLAYRANRATDQSPGNGLFNGTYGLLSQITYRPTKDFGFGVQYINAYYPEAFVPATCPQGVIPAPCPAQSRSNVAGGTGSDNAQRPFANNTATQVNAYGVVAGYTVNPGFIISGWAGLAEARGQSGADAGRNASLANWMVTLGFPDLGQKGNFGALSVGMPPKVTSNDNSGRRDPDTSLHFEASYRHQITENIAITPGFFVITNPNHNSANPTQVVGVVRTTLAF
jgi:hypothetical protein